MKARVYREILKGKRVTIGVLSFLLFFMTNCGGSDSMGEAQLSPDSDFVGEASSPPDQDTQSKESLPESQGSNESDTDHCDLMPQEIKGDGILAIGDSITGWYKNETCGQSYSDYASIEINEYIQNEAIGGTRLSGEIAGFLPSIPRQYAKATAVNGPYDVVVLTGGGNDLMHDRKAGKIECKITTQTCTESCRNKIEEIVEEMETLVTEIVRDGSDVILVGYYSIKQSTERSWYNECVSAINSGYQEIADSSPYISFVNTMDLVDPYDASDYAPDGLHPSISLAKKIGERVADAF